MAQLLLDVFYSLGNCLNCFPGSPTLKINSRSFKTLRLLGEGGFSYVYLVQDTATSELLALKKIRCPFGAESVAQAMKEVEAYKLFSHSAGIIHSVDYSIAGERGDPSFKTVYVLLPYYRRGNLQDMINANLVNHTRFPEKRLMLLFLGVCRALRDMHLYTGAGAGGGTGRERMEVGGVGGGAGARTTGHGDHDDHDDDDGSSDDETGESGKALGKKKKQAQQKRAKGRAAGAGSSSRHTGGDDEDESEQQLPLMVGGDHGGGAQHGTPRSYAHRDIKPGNIMISDSGSDPILMDLGSVAESPLPITSRSLAIATQDTAAEHSTMPYRAPELFDVKTGTVIDTKVDIWSLGCTLYACLVGKSPFEMRSDETGGSLSICVLSGDWRFPDEGIRRQDSMGINKAKAAAAADPSSSGAGAASADSTSISEPIRNVVRTCLNVEPAERPDIDGLIELVDKVIVELPDDDST